MEGISVNVVKPVQFFRFLKGRCHGNQFSGKNEAKLPTPLHLLLCHSDLEWAIAISMCALTAQMMPLNHVKIWSNLVQ